MGALQAQVLAQEVGERAPRLHLALVPTAVDLDPHRECRAHTLSVAWARADASRSARRARTGATRRRYAAEASTSSTGSIPDSSSSSAPSSLTAAVASRRYGLASTHSKTSSARPSGETTAAAASCA